MLTANVGDVADRRELRHAYAGDDPRGADRTRTDADFHRAGTCGNEIARALFGDDVASNHRHVRQRAELADHFHDVAGVAGGGVDEECICTRVDQHAAAVDAIRTHTDGSTAAELAVRVFGSVGERDALFDVRSGDESDQAVAFIDERKFLDTVLIENAPRFFEAGVARRGDQPVARRHHVRDTGVGAIQVADVAAGDHAFEPPLCVDDREAGEAVFGHYRANVIDRVLFANGVGFLNHRVFRALDPGNHRRLLVDRARAVDHAHAAFAGQCDRQIVFGNRVHRRRNDGKKERNTRRDVRGKICLTGQHRAESRHQKHVVK